jgi:protein translocase SecG subunit
MALLIGFLTFILVVNCLFLILLVLIQLPKKDAGAGVAFGGGATDALFGAGSGNALTKMTKYAATMFIGMALILAVLNAQNHNRSSRTIDERLNSKAAAAPATAPVLPTKAPDASKFVPLTTTPAPATPAATTPGAPTVTTPSTGTPQLQLQPTPATPAPAQPAPAPGPQGTAPEKPAAGTPVAPAQTPPK